MRRSLVLKISRMARESSSLDRLYSLLISRIWLWTSWGFVKSQASTASRSRTVIRIGTSISLITSADRVMFIVASGGHPVELVEDIVESGARRANSSGYERRDHDSCALVDMPRYSPRDVRFLTEDRGFFNPFAEIVVISLRVTEARYLSGPILKEGKKSLVFGKDQSRMRMVSRHSVGGKYKGDKKRIRKMDRGN